MTPGNTQFTVNHKTSTFFSSLGRLQAIYDRSFVTLFLGSVAVFSACDNQTKPLYSSTAKTGKHTDPVWEVTTL